MSLIVVLLPKVAKSHDIFNELELMGLAISVEVQRTSGQIGQYHHGQRYGHSQPYCTAPPRCVEYAQEHVTQLCPLTDHDARTCAKCSQNHPANSLGCKFVSRNNNEP
ncbi:unnamed protein product [Acanthoscelides obtectus]|uniref:Uncharacterized protein n=1 Tax=Acanthoscelides obtectus TaxID=200917 RepID=A0A9P0PWM8_ACAOB|nr:unnamed protein product [Acanthoscelides obtectus]CAK1668568.1 hypothetical protein AOBTE_LOCUS26490 [Acanthoscelides obtectus]